MQAHPSIRRFLDLEAVVDEEDKEDEEDDQDLQGKAHKAIFPTDCFLLTVVCHHQKLLSMIPQKMNQVSESTPTII